jgi:cytochrome o ubiquinol oxidase subunit 3
MSDATARAKMREEIETTPIRLLGFWVYIMSDCILFGTLFATYAVLSKNYAGGPTGKELFDLRGVLLETGCLLASSFTYGLVTLSNNQGMRQQVVGWLAVTIVLGASFVTLEVREFAGMIAAGDGPDRSAFLSAFFTLVSTHGLHVTIGLIWMTTLTVRIALKGLTVGTGRSVMTLSLFWHFLDIVWICIFSFVYLMGVL